MDTNNSSDHQPIEAPSGLDLHPQPQKAVRISRRASMAHHLCDRAPAARVRLRRIPPNAHQSSRCPRCWSPRNVTPATQAGTEFMQATPAGTVPMTLPSSRIHPPDLPSHRWPSCGADPKTGQPYRFNPQTGQLCDGLPQERVVVRQAERRYTPSRSHRRQSTRRLRKSAGWPLRTSESRRRSGAHRHPQFRGLIASATPGQSASRRPFSGRSPEPCSGRAAGR